MGCKEKIEFLGEFSRNEDGKFYIRFSDAAYVRSDIILLDRTDNSIHAILCGAAHLIGYVDGAMAKSLSDDEEAILSAPHYYSGSVELTSRVVVN